MRANDCLTPVGGVSYTCHDNGNLTNDGTYIYTWSLVGSGSPLRSESAAGRLVGTEGARQGEESITYTVVYAYPAFGGISAARRQRRLPFGTFAGQACGWR